MRAAAVITAKRFNAAKQRMSTGVPEERRLALVEAMLGDVLEAVSSSRMVDLRIVVTGEPVAMGSASAAAPT